MLRQDDFLKAQLVTAGWLHGKEYGGHLASCMVMATLMNRVKAGWGTLLEVIERIPMYAATTELPTGIPSLWEPSFIKLLHEVEGIYDGSVPDVSKGALYWGDTRRIETPFFQNKILGNPDHPRTVDMNSLVFWK